MKLRPFATISLAAVAASAIAGGTAHAAPALAPAPAPASAAPAVRWMVTRTANTVQVTSNDGTLAVDDGHLILRRGDGAVAESVPLALAVNSVLYPITAQLAGDHAATLTAHTSPAAATAMLAKYPHLKAADLPAAVSAVQPAIGLTSTVGGFLGAATGLVGGCLLGAAAAGVVSAPTLLLFGAGPLGGCVGGALLLGSGSSLSGATAGGLGATAANTPHFIELMNQPSTPKK